MVATTARNRGQKAAISRRKKREEVDRWVADALAAIVSAGRERDEVYGFDASGLITVSLIPTEEAFRLTLHGCHHDTYHITSSDRWIILDPDEATALSQRLLEGRAQR